MLNTMDLMFLASLEEGHTECECCKKMTPTSEMIEGLCQSCFRESIESKYSFVDEYYNGY